MGDCKLRQLSTHTQACGFTPQFITESYHSAHNFRSELEPKFYSDTTSFQVTLFNLNYSLNHLEIEKGAIRTEKGAIRTEEGAIDTEEGAIRTEEGAIHTEKGAIRTEEGAIHTEKGAIRTEEGAIQQNGIDIDRRLVSLDLPLSMQESISSIMKEKGSCWIFSCSEIAEFTNPQASQWD